MSKLRTLADVMGKGLTAFLRLPFGRPRTADSHGAVLYTDPVTRRPMAVCPDGVVVALSGTGGGSSDHATLTHLAYADAAHTGFAPSSPSYVTLGTSADLTSERVLTGTANRITLTDGGAGTTVTVDIAATYVGQTSITTLGTIATGVWSGTTIAATKGGTGYASYAVGDHLYADTTTTLAKVAAPASGARVGKVWGWVNDTTPGWVAAFSFFGLTVYQYASAVGMDETHYAIATGGTLGGP